MRVNARIIMFIREKGKRKTIENFIDFSFCFGITSFLLQKSPLTFFYCTFCRQYFFFVMPSSFDAVKQKQIFFQRYAASLPYLGKRSDERGKINSATRSPARLSTGVWRILAYTLLEIQHAHTVECPRTRSQFGHRRTRAHRRNLPAS